MSKVEIVNILKKILREIIIGIRIFFKKWGYFENVYKIEKCKVKFNLLNLILL